MCEAEHLVVSKSYTLLNEMVFGIALSLTSTHYRHARTSPSQTWVIQVVFFSDGTLFGSIGLTQSQKHLNNRWRYLQHIFFKTGR